MKKIIGIALILLSIGLGYKGTTAISNSGTEAEVLGIEIGVEDTGKKTNGFVFIGLAVVSFIGGVTLVGKK